MLKKAGIEPAPNRKKGLAWADFLKSHWSVMAAMDFFRFGESSLRRALSEVEIFYNRERPHQGMGNKIILPNVEEMEGGGVINCRSRLGGLLNYYHRKAA